jgi:hypothetical protein
MMIKKESIPSFLKEQAHELTLKRVEINKERYKGTHKERTGSKISLLLGEVDRAYYTDYLGIISELIIRWHYDINPEFVGFKASSFIKKGKLVTDDCDLEVYKIVDKEEVRVRVSIKACEGSFKANVKAMNRETSDIVIFVLFTGPNEYVIADFTPDEVRTWKQNFGFSPYYELKP